MQMGIFRYISDFRKKRSKHCASHSSKQTKQLHNTLFVHQKKQNKHCLFRFTFFQSTQTTPNLLVFRLHKSMIEKRKEKRSHHQRDSK